MLVSEIFYSIQGEGVNAGVPAVFLRTALCNLRCVWCDSVAEGTLVRTANKKWKPIESIEPGEELLGILGKKVTSERIAYGRMFYSGSLATGLSFHTGSEGVELTLENGERLLVTPNHPILAKTPHYPRHATGFFGPFLGLSRHNLSWKWVRAADLRVGDTLWYIGPPCRNSETSDYVLGWLVGYSAGGGGYSRNGRRWETMTVEIRNRLTTYLSRLNCKWRESVESTKTGRRLYRVDSTDFAELERRVKIDNSEKMRGFVGGFYDAEGDNHGFQAYFTNKNAKLLKYVASMLDQFGFTCDTINGKGASGLVVKGGVYERLRFDSLFDYAKPHDRKWLFGEVGLRGGAPKFNKHYAKKEIRVAGIRRIHGFFNFYDVGSECENFFANGILVHNSKYTWDWKNYDITSETHQMSVEQVLKKILRFKCRHLVVTGGEPLLQQKELAELLRRLKADGFYVEVETGGTLTPGEELARHVDQWNVSPKLANSQNPRERRERPEALRFFAASQRSWFKFVVESEGDVEEVLALVERYRIPRGRVLLMPQARSREELEERSPLVAGLCKTHGLRFSPRLHIALWGGVRGT